MCRCGRKSLLETELGVVILRIRLFKNAILNGKENATAQYSLSKRQLRKIKKEAKKTNALELVNEEEKLNKEIEEAYKCHKMENGTQISSSLPPSEKDTRLHLITKLAAPIKNLNTASNTLFKNRKELRAKLLKKRILEAEKLAEQDYEDLVKQEEQN